MGNFKQLTSGGGYDLEKHEFFGPFNFNTDVAWALDGVIRWTGATNRRWSVAIHSVLVSLIAETVTDGNRRYGAAGLVHDLHEFIIGDIATPIARAISYDLVEALKCKVQAASEAKLGIPLEVSELVMSPEIKNADRAALFIEKKFFMAPEWRDWGVSYPPAEYMEAGYHAMNELLGPVFAKHSGADIFASQYAEYFGEQ